MERTIQAPVGRKSVADICDLVVDFYRVLAAFTDEHASFEKTKQFNFQVLDAMEVDLFHLKNATHAIFRREVDTSGQDGLSAEDLFDLLIGSAFHEALHLKEYVYTLLSYEKRYLQFEEKARGKKLAEHEEDFLHYSRQIVREARENLPAKASEVRDLFQDAKRQLEGILVRYRDNERLIRVLYSEAKLLERIYSTGGVAHVYRMVFEAGPLEGYVRAGLSFYRSGFYEAALEAFARAFEHSRDAGLEGRGRQWLQEIRARTEEMIRKGRGGDTAVALLEKVKPRLGKAASRVEE